MSRVCEHGGPGEPRAVVIEPRERFERRMRFPVEPPVHYRSRRAIAQIALPLSLDESAMLPIDARRSGKPFFSLRRLTSTAGLLHLTALRAVWLCPFGQCRGCDACGVCGFRYRGRVGADGLVRLAVLIGR